MKKNILSFILSLLMMPLAAWGQPTSLLLSKSFVSTQLGPYLEYLEDANGGWTVEDVISPERASKFQKNSNLIFSAGVTDSVYWFRFKVNNIEPESRSLIFRIEHDYPDLKIYSITADSPPQLVISKSIKKLMNTANSREELMESRLVIPAKQEAHYLVRLESQADIKAFFSLWEPEALIKQNFFEYSFYLFCWGGVTFFILIFSFIFMKVREPIYFQYSAFLFCFMVFKIYFNLWFDLFPIKSEWGLWLGLACIYGSIYFGVNFGSYFIKNNELFPSFDFWSRRFLLVVIISLFAVSFFKKSLNLGYIFSLFLTTFYCLYIFSITCIFLFKKKLSLFFWGGQLC